MENTKKIARASYSLEEEYQELLRRITKRTRRSMTDELRIMIDLRAKSVGLTPINDTAEALNAEQEPVAK